ncbi:hypothetical protein M3M35_00495 [Fructilactobacillus myrtifloralis]|uniref:Uncharacterized protein n=1 Tax=Fructilactobacillus myrtifloralis TaxID=2940301 RepID=A0ABY5BNY3_9LACO|nr:hypothetical protein [Fructilactobacillus myrtifloralis]USS85189.1 hypothetical protein M3M35_00495 [Fructilactobacillus myrtifloralis]
MSKKEIVATGLVLVMLVCLLLQGLLALFHTETKLARFNHLLESVYCLCLVGIGMLVVLIAVMHTNAP